MKRLLNAYLVVQSVVEENLVFRSLRHALVALVLAIRLTV